MPLKLIIANKAYSSWSLRPWILLAHFHIPFEETVIPLDLPETREKILEHSPSGKCPALRDGAVEVWESLSIVEYVAEKFPEKTIWPRGKGARALARSLASEMHAGFQALRQHCPTQFRRPVRKIALTPEVVDWIIETTCKDRSYGARPLRRAIQRYVEDPLSEELIRGHLRGGEIEVYLEAGALAYRPAGELEAGRKLA